MRSPIERMIDDACGIVVEAKSDLSKLAREAQVAALIELADAATEWAAGEPRALMAATRVRLAAETLIDLGWREADQ